ncbi:MAG: HDIG domain-containing protein [Patescibacteria group bacterium]|nr:HDIG domain-containing protein [Patescibacteria group bacterium]
MIPNRDEAWKLLAEYVQSESLRKHCLSVEAAMRAYAKKYSEDEELWGICGLLHDFDYEKYPVPAVAEAMAGKPDADARTGHPFEGEKILREKEYPEEVMRIILGHALYSGVPRDTNAAKCLFAVDELCGFVMAIAHMKPDKFASLNVQSVEKRLKEKRFAAKVSREDIEQGIAELGVNRAEHIQLVIDAMAGIKEVLFPLT